MITAAKIARLSRQVAQAAPRERVGQRAVIEVFSTPYGDAVRARDGDETLWSASAPSGAAARAMATALRALQERRGHIF